MRDRRRLFNLVKGETRFEMKATNDAAQLYLYDEISFFGVMAADFVSEMSGLSGQDLELHVNSPGGDVFEGLAILNTLRSYPGKVTAVVDGVAASAASFILMGANEVVMQPNTEIMIHDAWGMCLGNSADMVDMAQRLDKVSSNIANIYSGKAGGDDETWRSRMREEAWYGADEAVTVGLADRVETRKTSGAPVAYDLSRISARKVDDKNEEPFDFAGLFNALEEALA